MSALISEPDRLGMLVQRSLKTKTLLYKPPRPPPIQLRRWKIGLTDKVLHAQRVKCVNAYTGVFERQHEVRQGRKDQEVVGEHR